MSTEATEVKAIGKTGLADVAKMDELKTLGWRVEKLESGWSAYEISGDRKIGPAASMKALHTQVMLASGPPVEKGNGKTFKVDSQPVLTGTKAAVMEDLRSAGLAYRKTTMEIIDLQAVQKDQKKEVIGLMTKFQDELSTDPDTGAKYFQVEMVIIELVTEEKEVLKTRLASE